MHIKRNPISCVYIRGKWERGACGRNVNYVNEKDGDPRSLHDTCGCERHLMSDHSMNDSALCGGRTWSHRNGRKNLDAPFRRHTHDIRYSKTSAHSAVRVISDVDNRSSGRISFEAILGFSPARLMQETGPVIFILSNWRSRRNNSGVERAHTSAWP